jgi:hypothetical protein
VTGAPELKSGLLDDEPPGDVEDADGRSPGELEPSPALPAEEPPGDVEDASGRSPGVKSSSATAGVSAALVAGGRVGGAGAGVTAL